MSFLSFAMNFVLLPPEMMAPQHIHIDDYAYPLPDDRIARYPLPQRDRSKLLVYRGGQIGETVFNRLPDELPSDALLVFNNTRVIRARLLFHKTTGAQIELFCLEPAEPADYAQIFQQTEQCSWHCLIGNLKKWKDGTLTRTVYLGEESVRLTAEREETHGTSHLVTFRWDDSRYTFAEVLEAAGILPIPPYLRRETEPTDLQTYQTVYSRIKGSVAAPTAGLHFTPKVLAELDARGIGREEVTLHVGAGTFKPVKSPTIGSHEMHTEHFAVSRRTIERLITASGPVIAVGTTSVRTLESLYYLGARLSMTGLTDHADLPTVEQWTPYTDEVPCISAREALQHLLDHLDHQGVDRLVAATRIILAPGYEFKIVRGMITNFHQPQSTLLLLVSAFVKGDWKAIYDYALDHNFRFLSYGDSSLLL
ncbi:S-adenosylmethionine:tRNA ribosyltransferase-isomerase [Tannerella forsythia]|uniref:S-adenosylmethionine:tRNA ribosyltransferase-isomerase n=1 Tax=Tannerella forsythia TaxID=28112 RepID=UPI00241F7904|nr:S-adenosylmethionine:tRNA ribosyltransferase-isomerase [Tannerella forsythia]